MSPQVETGDWRAGAGFRQRRANRGWYCFGLKLGEIREDFLELVFFPLGTFSALGGKTASGGMGASFAGGQRGELAQPLWRSGVPGWKRGEVQGYIW